MGTVPPQVRWEIMKTLPENLDNKRILDIGCGFGENGLWIRMRKRGTPEIIGFDIFDPYVRILKKLGIYDNVFKLDLKEINAKKFTSEWGKFDIVLCTEVLEHIGVNESKNILKEIRLLHNEMLIVSVPYGKTGCNTRTENPYNAHKEDYWTEAFFKDDLTSVKLLDIQPLTRTTRLFDDIRRRIFGLDKHPKGIFTVSRIGRLN